MERSVKKFVLLLAASTVMAGAPSAWAEFGPGEARFRDIYKELVETNTSLSVGLCFFGTKDGTI